MASSSEFFRNIFYNVSTRDNLFLYLNGIQEKHLQILMKFIYCGSVEVQENDVEMVLAGAKILKLNGFHDGDENNDETLESKTQEWIEENVDGINPNHKKKSQNGSKIKSTDKEATSYQDAFKMKLETAVDEDKNPGALNRLFKKQFHCDICDLSYSSQGALLNHKRGIHQGIVFRCEYGCGFSANQAGNLKTHVAKKHSNGL